MISPQTFVLSRHPDAYASSTPTREGGFSTCIRSGVGQGAVDLSRRITHDKPSEALLLAWEDAATKLSHAL